MDRYCTFKVLLKFIIIPSSMLKTSCHSRGVSSSHIDMQSIMGSAWSLMIPAQHLPASLLPLLRPDGFSASDRTGRICIQRAAGSASKQ